MYVFISVHLSVASVCYECIFTYKLQRSMFAIGYLGLLCQFTTNISVSFSVLIMLDSKTLQEFLSVTVNVRM